MFVFLHLEDIILNYENGILNRYQEKFSQKVKSEHHNLNFENFGNLRWDKPNDYDYSGYLEISRDGVIT